ncbi:hypothetical protein IF1G_00656 [Cordyceps javanica]|uniref:Uncharacterized protein n=1 Tax=Cordyceps javanica TaxID=43265 RepID=A0A545VG68_9HYPO|nr:hypothetical protein IF1G_00656 [Cordyceps javanica]
MSKGPILTRVSISHGCGTGPAPLRRCCYLSIDGVLQQLLVGLTTRCMQSSFWPDRRYEHKLEAIRSIKMAHRHVCYFWTLSFSRQSPSLADCCARATLYAGETEIANVFAEAECVATILQ